MIPQIFEEFRSKMKERNDFSIEQNKIITTCQKIFENWLYEQKDVYSTDGKCYIAWTQYANESYKAKLCCEERIK